MTKEENLTYRRECPYDAMGDYSVFFTKEAQDRGIGKTEDFQSDVSVKQIK